MASPDAIAATTAALQLLFERAALDVSDYKSTLTVAPYQASDLQKPVSPEALTLSIFLYRACVSDGLRNVPVGYLNGLPRRPAIPVDLFYLITAWASSATVQQRLLGWAIRTLEDTSTLPSTLLNEGNWTGVFGASEAVEMVWHPLTAQEEYDLWQIAQTNQQPSASYVARTIALESSLTAPAAPLAQTLDARLGVIAG
jgi:hypothetical protein